MNLETSQIKLRPISKYDYRFLFILLKNRDPNTSISHKKMPTYADHIKFVNSKPYSKWYVIEYRRTKAGSIYLTKNNEIGIFIKKNLHRCDIGRNAINLLMKENPKKRFLANVSPKNHKSIKFFKKNGFRLIQYTFESEIK